MAEGLTCPICLLPDDPESMVAATIEKSLYGRPVKVKLCRGCAFAIKAAADASGELPPYVEVIAAKDQPGEG